MALDIEIDRPQEASWWLQLPPDFVAAESEVPEAGWTNDAGAYYRARAEEFRRRPTGPSDDDEWDSTLF
jgi:hypothetical protein